ncbi:MAG TPA: bifunctional pyr operon transcriptional regulator/uracil phosphoribosyltransferase PyrR [Holophagaceae bacterium]|nr:bifunctional pyr operon transcriptional regulator/uracil phosphoribosyltransferase PyrR [Holophagaceae bacterium]HJW33102.1 bifunctional pyr operon transcriptional regulator/uracil phosphoribosyltransferase PyrR [Holophagaceae bacterium]
MTGPCQLDPAQMEGALHRMAGDVAARLGDDNLVLLGIRSRGLPLAERLGAALSKALGREIPVGALDITLYRDDLTELIGVPIVRPTEIPFTLKDRTILLVDDVLFTGRTIRAALDALLDHGRPKTVRLAVLVDRGGRELPIQADFAAVTLAVTATQRVSVKVKELDGEDGVFLETRG